MAAKITGGQANITPTANTMAGSYGVIARATGTSSVTFTLINITLTRITLTPPSGVGNPPSFKIGQTIPLTAMGTYTDGSMQTITKQVQWSSSNPQVARVDATGKVRGKRRER